MTDQQEGSELSELLDGLRTDANEYFEKAFDTIFDANLRLRQPDDPAFSPRRDKYWWRLTEEIRAEAKRLDRRLVFLMGQIARSVRNAPLTSEADQRDVMTGTKAMRAALFSANSVGGTRRF